MKCNIDLFIARTTDSEQIDELRRWAAEPAVEHIHLLSTTQAVPVTEWPVKCSPLLTDRLGSSRTLRAIAAHSTARYVALILRPVSITPTYRGLTRLLAAAEQTGALLTYSDRMEEREGGITPHPVIDYMPGSLRDDFDFGSLYLIRREALCAFAESREAENYRYAAPYALRLYLSRDGEIFHLPEALYTETETDLRRSGEKQFDYVNPAAREVQIENERAVTEHLKRIGAWLSPEEVDDLPIDTAEYPVEASVIIPVRDRHATIADAVRSVLEQEADFDYNIIVVDNHSTDGTAEVVAEMAAHDSRIHLIRPERTDLGIGGCWDTAIRDEACGRYAVQLDSDDLYSGPDTLSRIVAAFRTGDVAMVVGSYRIVDFALNTLPPGLIDHREWTDDNGRNNALRIGGLGAPRAFRTDLLRRTGFPNTSYGEDYALGLAFSRHYRIRRIYDELYLCRRWDGNSDAALSIERTNRNNLYKDRLRTLEIMARRDMIRRWRHTASQEEIIEFIKRQMLCWPEVKERFEEVKFSIRTRALALEDYELAVQYNPRRIVSTAAKIDKRNLKKRPCFLCDKNRPAEQISMPVEGAYQVLVNPYPILPNHLTIPTRRHMPQKLATILDALGRMAWQMPDFLLFFNGARCGASAPDHAHLQAGARGYVPLERDWKYYASRLEKIYPLTGADEAGLEEKGYNTMGVGLYLLHGYACPAFVLLGGQAGGDYYLFQKLIAALPTPKGQSEPDINLLAWRGEGGPGESDSVIMVLFPRLKHRPDCYFAEGDEAFTISPGALDMGGLIITPREEDFSRITSERAAAILREVSYTEEQVKSVMRKLYAGAERTERDEDDAEPFTLSSEPGVSVGILQADHIRFTLDGEFTAKGEGVTGPQEAICRDGGILWGGNLYSELTFIPSRTDACSFTLEDVAIGRGFHWEQREPQTFRGVMRIIVSEESLIVINTLPVEAYLTSVISSEMNASSGIELLKAHAVISRSWLFHQMKHRHERRSGSDFFSFVRKEDEYIRWYDREEHTLFDVCADDHCQRYQGITRATLPAVAEAVKRTRGVVLMNDGELCDARFSKCCGGVTEQFSTAWGGEDKDYLAPISDTPENAPVDLSDHVAAEAWIRSTPDAFCHTTDKELLRQVLNDYDTSTDNFYRWRVSYTAEELTAIVSEKREEDFGDIIDLVPIERGEGGRIKRLQIVGTKKRLIIGKELEIRRSLSHTHLYSSAFVVERETDAEGRPARFTLIGAGWGHGVGLCQIGAAVMSHEGYDYKQILKHYYTGADLKRLYR